MGPFAGTTFGIGTPSVYPNLPISGATTPYSGQSPYFQQGIGLGQSPQQLLQLLQVVTQQLQQVQALEQQQLFYLQQLLQFIPAQLQQLQQLVQIIPQQIQQQHQQQWHPLNQGLSSPFGITPQAFAAQPAGHVM
jgi:hypothetical protein